MRASREAKGGRLTVCVRAGQVVKAVTDVNKKLAKDWASFYAGVSPSSLALRSIALLISNSSLATAPWQQNISSRILATAVRNTALLHQAATVSAADCLKMFAFCLSASLPAALSAYVHSISAAAAAERPAAAERSFCTIARRASSRFRRTQRSSRQCREWHTTRERAGKHWQKAAEEGEG
jgi:hypothetical protein